MLTHITLFGQIGLIHTIKDDGKSKYHFEDHVESLTVGNQTFIFQQNHPEWIGLMFMQELQLIVHNISISLLQISNDGRSFNFSMPHTICCAQQTMSVLEMVVIDGCT